MQKTSEIHKAPSFELVAGNTALDFVNTLDWRFRPTGPEELLNGYVDLLRFAFQTEIISNEQAEKLARRVSRSEAESVVKSCLELREALANTLYAGLNFQAPAQATINALERYFCEAQVPQRLVWKQSRLQWSWAGLETEAEFPLWLLSSAAFQLLSSEMANTVRACDNPECRWLFADASKNHTRRWCDMKVCGNRMKARRFKAQRAT